MPLFFSCSLSTVFWTNFTLFKKKNKKNKTKTKKNIKAKTKTEQNKTKQNKPKQNKSKVNGNFTRHLHDVCLKIFDINVCTN